MTRTAVEAPQSRLSYAAIAEYTDRIAADHGVVEDTGKADVYALLTNLGGRIEVDNRVESFEVRQRPRLRCISAHSHFADA